MSIDDVTPEEWDRVARGQALQKQVGGSHYKSYGDFQPIEVCYRRYGYPGVKASLHLKVDKYLTRDKGDGLENIEKAIHCLELLRDYYVKEFQ